MAAISVSRELCPCVPFEVVLIDIPDLVERDEVVLRCANVETSSRRSTSACLGALRSRLRSLWTQQRCTAAVGHTWLTTRRRPGLPSMMQSSGAARPRVEPAGGRLPRARAQRSVERRPSTRARVERDAVRMGPVDPWKSYGEPLSDCELAVRDVIDRSVDPSGGGRAAHGRRPRSRPLSEAPGRGHAAATPCSSPGSGRSARRPRTASGARRGSSRSGSAASSPWR